MVPIPPGDVLVEQDAFTSTHLGRPVYRLCQLERAGEALTEVLRYPRPLMVEAKVATECVRILADLTTIGFRIVDTTVQLNTSPAALSAAANRPPGVRVRAATVSDRTAVETLSANNLVTSRFHLDPRLPTAAASQVKRAWVGNFFDGLRGERLLVVEEHHGLGGFLLTLERGGEGIIDLVALAPAWRGRGALDALLLEWVARAPGLTCLLVGTQISNVRSLRAYERLGFRVRASHYVLHFHA